MAIALHDVRFWGQSGHWLEMPRCLLLTQSGHERPRFAVPHKTAAHVINCCPWPGGGWM